MEDDYWWSKARRRLINRLLRKYSATPNPRIIDVGCGGGGFLGSLNGKGRLFGLEHSAFGAECTAKKTGARVVLGDAGSLPFKDNCFDVLTSLDVIEHLDFDDKALRDFYRVLATEGIAILTVPAFNLLWSPRDDMLHHKRRYTAKGLKRLLESSGFRVIRCSYTNSFYLPGLVLYSIFRRAFRQEIKPTTHILSLPSRLASLFNWILKVEETVLMHSNLPVGTSIICVAKKGIPDA